jgi:FKBP-type peptidyl-prolyl cis-trans isomerase
MKSCIRADAKPREFGFALAACLLLAAFLSGEALAKIPKTEDEKTLYFIGMVISGQPPFSTLRPAEVDLVAQGLKDSLADETIELDPTEYGEKVQAFVQARMEEQIGKQKKEGEVYLAKMAASDGAKTTESGLIFIESEAGEGDSPNTTDTVKVHYHGTLSDGTVFDSSRERGQPAEFPLNRVIPCWTEGVAMMKPGGKAQLVCPSDVAYGDRGAPPTIPGGATLTFEVELLEVVPVP